MYVILGKNKPSSCLLIFQCPFIAKVPQIIVFAFSHFLDSTPQAEFPFQHFTPVVKVTIAIHIANSNGYFFVFILLNFSLGFDPQLPS